MTSKGHRLTGLAAGIIAGAVTAQFGGMSLLALIASTIGGTAPDDLEIWRKVKGTNTGKAPLIQHRTITHVFLLWLVLLAYSGYHLGEGLHWDFLFGYAMGGLMHLVVDFPNPMGVPFLHPKIRYSLGWWKSGQYESLIVICMFFFAFSVAHALNWSPLGL